ncbi:MAG: 1-deoxy-D-xylulose-5-phosphate reductoisomerase [Phycisphaerae bacterium]|nr:1-deoxy-D-xylulose-5-phosphate reductoisomerase [Phycisphaerae bacterium]
MSAKRVAILGSTGSIGRQSLEVIAATDSLRACALAAGSNWQLLGEQARRFRPQIVALSNADAAERLRAMLPAGVEMLAGPSAMTELVRRSRPDVVLSGVVGTAGLAPTLAAIEAGATLAIANKETLVMAGAIVMPAARKAGVAVLPVDSEHSAIFQCLCAGRREEVARVVITASGGALRGWEHQRAEQATVQEALDHPTWQMGPKVTIDSATLINKALEVVEAHWLFDLPAEQIQVVLHEESIVHSYVEFRDGSVIAQMGRPDMALPIAYALSYPQRLDRATPPLDLPALGKLTFSALDGRLARAVELGYQAITRGGVTGAVLNAANETAVQAFLDGRIRFGQIVPLVEDVLSRSPAMSEITLEALLEADRWARAQLQARLTAGAPAQATGHT